MIHRIRRALVATIAGTMTVVGAAVLVAPPAHAVTPCFTGTSACDTTARTPGTHLHGAEPAGDLHHLRRHSDQHRLHQDRHGDHLHVGA